jgi:hypothetical protein
MWFAIAIGIIDFISIPWSNAGGHIAHLGGAFAGWLFVVQYKKGNDWSKAFTWFFTKFHFTTTKKMKFNKGGYQPMSHRFPNEIPNTAKGQERMNQKRIDEILEKISKSGYDSLSKDEKEFLLSFSDKK